jgi:hypothetical protein
MYVSMKCASLALTALGYALCIAIYSCIYNLTHFKRLLKDSSANKMAKTGMFALYSLITYTYDFQGAGNRTYKLRLPANYALAPASIDYGSFMNFMLCILISVGHDYICFICQNRPR